MKIKHMGMWAAGIALLIVLLQNTQVVSVRLLFWKISMSRIILLPMVMLFGCICGFFIGKNKQS